MLVIEYNHKERGCKKMGFFDALQTVGEYVGAEAVKKCETIFKHYNDSQLLNWWDEKQYDPDVDQRIKDVAEKELRRRHLL